jgi:hypothetical protein
MYVLLSVPPALCCFALFVKLCVICVLCVCLFMCDLSWDCEGTGWQFRADIALLKTMYGLLSLPFVLFITPLAPLLLHLRPTGYDRNGQVTPVKIIRSDVEAPRQGRKLKSE